MIKKIVYKIFIIIILTIILFVAFNIISTYGLFQSEKSGVIKQKNATWLINVNNKNITSKTNNFFVIDNIELQRNEHVAPNRVAPNVFGCFYIVIDPKNTDVSIRYDITIKQPNMENDKITISSIEEIEKNKKLIKTGENTYTGIITLKEIKDGTINKIRVKLNWENDDLNNKNDTSIGKIKEYKIDIPINLKLTQYLGETIKEYIP